MPVTAGRIGVRPLADGPVAASGWRFDLDRPSISESEPGIKLEFPWGRQYEKNT